MFLFLLLALGWLYIYIQVSPVLLVHHRCSSDPRCPSASFFSVYSLLSVPSL